MECEPGDTLMGGGGGASAACADACYVRKRFTSRPAIALFWIAGARNRAARYLPAMAAPRASARSHIRR
jgi:hypothetical protein